MAKMMFDMQKLVDAMGDAARVERSNYHLTLGEAIAKLEAMDAALPVVCSDDTSSAPGYAMSYRGYYSDLAFAPVPATDVGAFLATCRNALDTTMEGYKGGEYLMHKDVPLWIAEYGCSGNRAVVDLVQVDDKAVLVIKNLER